MSVLTYLWHYTVARLLYDDLLRPLGTAALVLAVAVAVFSVLVARRRRSR